MPGRASHPSSNRIQLRTRAFGRAGRAYSSMSLYLLAWRRHPNSQEVMQVVTGGWTPVCCRQELPRGCGLDSGRDRLYDRPTERSFHLRKWGSGAAAQARSTLHAIGASDNLRAKGLLCDHVVHRASIRGGIGGQRLDPGCAN